MLRGGLALLLAVAGACAEDVTIESKDAWSLPATIWAEAGAKKPAPAVILIHQMNGTRSDWSDLAARLVKEGYVVLAYDMRGHGGALHEKSGRAWKQFTADSDWLGMIDDLGAAWKLLAARKEVDPSKVWVIGASIGANTALAFAASEPKVHGVVLLSPGFDYHHIKTEEPMKKYDRPVLLAASRDDAQSWNDTSKLSEEAKGPKDFAQFDASGHGVNMLSKSPGLADRIVKFMAEH